MIRMIILALAMIAMMPAIAAQPASKPAPAPAVSQPRRDWSQAVVLTRAGGYLIGNPAAKVRVIEYFSLTCSHCRRFAVEGFPALKQNYVSPGLVSLELRNFVLNAPDLAASLLMRCGGPVKAVRLAEQVYADQEALFARMATLRAPALAEIEAAPRGQQMAVLARASGMLDWFASHGVNAKQGALCLAEPSRIKTLVALRESGTRLHGVMGTPAFVIDGILARDISMWSDLEPLILARLRAAAARPPLKIAGAL
jgi:protein-disulfide isomerase